MSQNQGPNSLMCDQTYIENLYSYLLAREASQQEAQAVLESFKRNTLSRQQLICQIVLSAEFFQRSIVNALDLHLYFIHFARIKMVSLLIPEAKVIVELGGANASIYDMGYPYEFDRIWLVDLPPQDRCEEYQHISLNDRATPNGPISVLYRSMTDLSVFEDSAVDLVWSGQSIEHVSEADAQLVYKEAYRVLRPDGWFCLDTPNRLLTEIHTEGYIHPEHKIEYYPDHLKQNLIESGFAIVEERGVCEMLNTYKTRKFDYRDFVVGNPLSHHVDSCYIQYYRCKKRE